MAKKRTPTVKQREILDHYLGNATDTAKKLGITPNYVRQVLHKPWCIEYLKNKQNNALSHRSRVIATREQRQLFWTNTMVDPEASMSDRLRASELLGRSNGDFTEKLITSSIDKELETLSDDEIKQRIKDNLTLIDGKRAKQVAAKKSGNPGNPGGAKKAANG